IAGSVEPPAACPTKMAGHLAPGLPDFGEGLWLSVEVELAGVQADDGGVARSGRLLAVLAAALRNEQRRPGHDVTDIAAKAAAFRRFTFSDRHPRAGARPASSWSRRSPWPG